MKRFQSLKRWQQGCALLVLLFFGCGFISLLLPNSTPEPDTSSVALNATEADTDTVTESVSVPTDTSVPANTSEPTVTPVPTSTPRPTVTRVPTSTPKPPEPKTYTGVGDDVIQVELPDTLSIAKITYTGGSNFSVFNLDSSFNPLDLLVNTIGSYSGIVALNFSGNGTTAGFEIAASGPWEITLYSLLFAEQFDDSVTGSGDNVLIYTGASGNVAHITNDGSSNFVVYAYGSRQDLLVNEIGSYDGTVRIQPDTLVFEVRSEGSWTIDVD